MAKQKEPSTFEEWTAVMSGIDLNEREPLWDQAIEYLVSECAIEPTICIGLSSDQIAQICKSDGYSICCTIVDFGIWVKANQIEYLDQIQFSDDVGEIWMAYLMATRYAMKWDGCNWVDIG